MALTCGIMTVRKENLLNIKIKIRKLIALSKDASSPKEAAIATIKFKQLLDKHDLDVFDIDIEDIELEEEKKAIFVELGTWKGANTHFRRNETPQWMILLGHALGQLYTFDVLTHRSKPLIYAAGLNEHGLLFAKLTFNTIAEIIRKQKGPDTSLWRESYGERCHE